MSCVLGTDAEGRPQPYCCYKQGSRKLAIAFDVKTDVPPTYRFGMWYHQIEPDEGDASDEDDDLLSIDELAITSYGLLLPMAKCWPPVPEEGHGQMYSLVSSDWQIMSAERILVLPHWYILQQEVQQENIDEANT